LPVSVTLLTGAAIDMVQDVAVIVRWAGPAGVPT